MSVACCDSTPGTRKLSLYSPPTLPCSDMTAKATTSQRPITRNGWRALLRPRRYRNALTVIPPAGARRVADKRTIQEVADSALRWHCHSASAPGQRVVRSRCDRRTMTKPTSTAARCDRIISLIDECLADVDARLRVITGD